MLIAQEDEAGGAVLIVNGHEPDPIRVTLQSTATVTGRLIDEQGKPRPNIPIVVNQSFGTISRHRFGVQPPTGADGRFRIGDSFPASPTASKRSRSTKRRIRIVSWAGSANRNRSSRPAKLRTGATFAPRNRTQSKQIPGGTERAVEPRQGATEPSALGIAVTGRFELAGNHG